ncbi:hypothetical protein RhiJN_24840 [Ceratobasidium sp. AG-Ba]|nr:hypothetical protein RhiJN_24840 [Ceratobasidium sp. AG-Ba]
MWFAPQRAVAKGPAPGIRVTKRSERAASLCLNDGEAQGSDTKVLMFCRVVVGRPFDTQKAGSANPPNEFDSVYEMSEKEYAIYDKNAIRVAYLVVLQQQDTDR